MDRLVFQGPDMVRGAHQGKGEFCSWFYRFRNDLDIETGLNSPGLVAFSCETLGISSQHM